MNRPIRAAVLGLALTLGSAGLAACSGGSSGTATPSSTSAAASASASPSGSAGRGFGGGLFASAKVQTCLKAAGITVPSRPSGSFPSRSRPSGSFPSGSRPSFSRPSGARPSGAGGFGGNSAENQKIQAALKACGITLPTGGNRARGSAATPTASPTS